LFVSGYRAGNSFLPFDERLLQAESPTAAFAYQKQLQVRNDYF
jgi:hypothetical protein